MEPMEPFALETLTWAQLVEHRSFLPLDPTGLAAQLLFVLPGSERRSTP